MAIPIRHSDAACAVAGARTFFVTSSIAGKRNLLQSDRSAGLFIRVLYDYRAQGKFRLHQFVVMPDHFHVLLTVESDLAVERGAVHQGAGSRFAPDGNSGSGLRFGRKDSQRCAFATSMRISRSRNTSVRIRSLGIWCPKRMSSRILRPTRDSNSTRRRRG